MAEYSQEDADEVFRQVYATLKAAIDFLTEMKVANPEGVSPLVPGLGKTNTGCGRRGLQL